MKRVLVTRPGQQAESLCQAIETVGDVAINFPLLVIEPLADDTRIKQAAQSLAGYDMVVFVSANAVRHFKPFLVEPVAHQGEWVAIGQATAAAMLDSGLPLTIKNQPPYTSEALLLLPQFADLSRQRVLIVKGVGGREHLAQQLQQRGATVDTIACYQRVMPDVDVRALVKQWHQQPIDAMVVTSSEALANLQTMLYDVLGGQLLVTPLVVISERLVEVAQRQGFTRVYCAGSGDDMAIVRALNYL